MTSNDEPKLKPDQTATHGDLTREDLLTVPEVCAWLKVSRAWVYDEVEAGRLPHVRVGRRLLRFRRSELEDYLAACSHRPTIPAPDARRKLRALTDPLGLEPLQ